MWTFMKVIICFNELMFNYGEKKIKGIEEKLNWTKLLNSMLNNIQLQKI
jgi:hypothetical protein